MSSDSFYHDLGACLSILAIVTTHVFEWGRLIFGEKKAPIERKPSLQTVTRVLAVLEAIYCYYWWSYIERFEGFWIHWLQVYFFCVPRFAAHFLISYYPVKKLVACVFSPPEKAGHSSKREWANWYVITFNISKVSSKEIAHFITTLVFIYDLVEIVFCTLILGSIFFT